MLNAAHMYSKIHVLSLICFGEELSSDQSKALLLLELLGPAISIPIGAVFPYVYIYIG